MIAGAALQKDSQALRESIRGNVKVSCFTCGAFYYTTAAQIRQGNHPCRCGAGPMLTANLLACQQLEPERLADHPDLAEASGHRDVMPRAGEGCGYCDHPRAPHLDRTYWYCRKCQHVNEECADGSIGVFRASPFSAEVEQANAMAGKRAGRIAVPVHAHRERVAPMQTAPDLPF